MSDSTVSESESTVSQDDVRKIKKWVTGAVVLTCLAVAACVMRIWQPKLFATDRREAVIFVYLFASYVGILALSGRAHKRASDQSAGSTKFRNLMSASYAFVILPALILVVVMAVASAGAGGPTSSGSSSRSQTAGAYAMYDGSGSGPADVASISKWSLRAYGGCTGFLSVSAVLLGLAYREMDTLDTETNDV
jgi:hypothetical protein